MLQEDINNSVGGWLKEVFYSPERLREEELRLQQQELNIEALQQIASQPAISTGAVSQNKAIYIIPAIAFVALITTILLIKKTKS